MKKKKSGIGGFFKEFGEAVVKRRSVRKNYPWSGWEQDISAENKLSKGILMTLLEVAVIVFTFGFANRVCT